MMDLKTLKKVHKAGGVLSSTTVTKVAWEYIEIPEELIVAWQDYLRTREAFINLLIQYDVIANKNEF